jgi:hypothetical protein
MEFVEQMTRRISTSWSKTGRTRPTRSLAAHIDLGGKMEDHVGVAARDDVGQLGVPNVARHEGVATGAVVLVGPLEVGGGGAGGVSISADEAALTSWAGEALIRAMSRLNERQRGNEHTPSVREPGGPRLSPRPQSRGASVVKGQVWPRRLGHASKHRCCRARSRPRAADP